MSRAKKSDELERLEINLLVEGVYQHYGCDFRDYAYASLRRRVWNVVRSEQLETVTARLDRVLRVTLLALVVRRREDEDAAYRDRSKRESWLVPVAEVMLDGN